MEVDIGATQVNQDLPLHRKPTHRESVQHESVVTRQLSILNTGSETSTKYGGTHQHSLTIGTPHDTRDQGSLMLSLHHATHAVIILIHVQSHWPVIKKRGNTNKKGETYITKVKHTFSKQIMTIFHFQHIHTIDSLMAATG